MKTSRVIIVSNGALYESIILDIKKNDVVIGVDRAAYWLLQHGIIPTIAVGDFDSTTAEEYAHIQKSVSDIRTFPPEKDFVDTELALIVALEQSPKEIVIYGGSGTRMDHELATLSLLERGIAKQVKILFRNETNEIQLISRCRTIVKKRGGFRYISIVPYSDAIVVSLEGLKYPLSHAVISRGQTIGVSNEFLNDRATATLHEGTAFIIQSKD